MDILLNAGVAAGQAHTRNVVNFNTNVFKRDRTHWRESRSGRVGVKIRKA